MDFHKSQVLCSFSFPAVHLPVFFPYRQITPIDDGDSPEARTSRMLQLENAWNIQHFQFYHPNLIQTSCSNCSAFFFKGVCQTMYELVPIYYTLIILLMIPLLRFFLFVSKAPQHETRPRSNWISQHHCDHKHPPGWSFPTLTERKNCWFFWNPLCGTSFWPFWDS